MECTDGTICVRAQRVEVVDPTEIRILGSKTELLRTLVAAAGVESAAAGVRGFIPKWRTRQVYRNSTKTIT
jgi:hypothetical protein